MSRVQMLRCLVNQRLTAAVEEVFELFERTIAEYEEQLSRSKEENERQQKLLEAVTNPDVQLHGTEVQKLTVRKEEVQPELQERSTNVNQEEPPEPAHIKEEQEEMWSNQEKEQLQGVEGADFSMFTFTHFPLKSEDAYVEKPQSSHLHKNQTKEERDTENLKTEAEGMHCGGSEDFNPDSHLQPVTSDKTLHLPRFDTDHSCDWERHDEPQEGLNPLQNKGVSFSDMIYNTGNTSVSLSECALSFGQNKHLQERKGVHLAERPFCCSVCSKRYPSKTLLQRHMQRHSVVKPHSCSVCKKSFIRRAELVIHMRVHTGEKPFSCLICGRRFTTSGSLKSHSILHTGEKPFSCNLCKRKFTWLRSVKIHKCILKTSNS
ncbi:zinc finger protein 583-like [Cheilinus undulatus]|uniref:zinc finger protein 583-like n=1 Tax=Cheilinus undulatus TaxID=241271 RepID=UPI001BD5BF47|nr:zinc finger protein 583-like [Cheilinus undulatus]